MGSLGARSFFVALLCGATLAACHTGGTSTLVGATTMTALAMGSAVAERAAGGCIAMCTTGTGCNPQTGLCEVLPCRNQCQATEHCEQTFTGDKCMPGGPTGVESVANANKPKIPVGVPTSSIPTTGGPTVVPAAEQSPPNGK
jgi:hypothetical protein